jgi:hypothetical protein
VCACVLVCLCLGVCDTERDSVCVHVCLCVCVFVCLCVCVPVFVCVCGGSRYIYILIYIMFGPV